MTARQDFRPSRQAGVSLIEVLVAIVVLAFGLVSVALLQTSALQNNFVSNQYTLAAAVAQGLSESMRGNRDGVISDSYDFAAGAVPPAPDTDCAVDPCSAAQRAAWDIAATYSNLADVTRYANVPEGPTQQLPNGQLQVACADAAACDDRSPRVISVYWDADRVGATTYGCNPAEPTDLKCFRLVHVP